MINMDRDSEIPRHRSKKDTKQWCRGKPGVKHQLQCMAYRDLSYGALDTITANWRILVCTECGKQLDHYYPMRYTDREGNLIRPVDPAPAWVNEMKYQATIFYAESKDNLPTWEGEVEANSTHDALEALFEKFNVGDRGGLKIRSMSVGDMVLLKDGENSAKFICKSFGWKNLHQET
jgi:hypothetical protein